MIKLGATFCPFCHEVPVRAPLPGTPLGAVIYPAYIKILDMHSEELFFEHHFDFGPLENFTVFLDIERKAITVQGKSKKGFVRYKIENDSFHFLKPEKSSITFTQPYPHMTHKREKLFFGCYKAQDIFSIRRRMQLSEIIPFWYLLAQSFPKQDDRSFEEPSLYAEAYACKDKNLFKEKLIDLFQAGFSGLFFPRLRDEDHLGYTLPVLTKERGISPVLLLQKSFGLLRKSFFQEGEGKLFFLPFLPKELPFGKMIDVQTKKGHTIAFEWTKRKVKCVKIQPVEDESFSLIFDKSIKRCRVNKSEWIENGAQVQLKRGRALFLDRFEK